MTYFMALLGLCLFAAVCVGLTDEILGYGVCKKCGKKLVEQGWYNEKTWCPKCDK
jgi:hypothetical protein